MVFKTSYTFPTAKYIRLRKSHLVSTTDTSTNITTVSPDTVYSQSVSLADFHIASHNRVTVCVWNTHRLPTYAQSPDLCNAGYFLLPN